MGRHISNEVCDSQKVAECLEDQVFCRFGALKTIITDHGSQFISKILKKLCKEWGVTHKFVSPYHPQANHSERTNRTLKTMIRCFLEEAHSAWDLHLQKFAFAIRSNFSEGTQVTPALLNLGREIPTLFDRQMSRTHTQLFYPETHATETQQKLDELVHWVRANLSSMHQKNKALYDTKHSDIAFAPNQKVLVRNHCLSDKESGFAAGLAPKWKGPYIVISQVTPVTYALAETPNRKPFTYHVQDIKPYFERDQHRDKLTIETPTPIPLIKSRNLRPKIRVNYRNLHLGRYTH